MKKKRLLLILAALLACALAIPIVLARRSSQKRIQKLEAAGMPVTPLELDVWYKQVPAAENAASIFWAAQRLYNPPPRGADPRDEKNFPKPGQPIPPTLEKMILNLVSANDGALQTLFTLRPDAPSRFPIDLSLGAGTLLPHCAHVKGFAQLLRFNAIVQCERTNREEAVHSVLTSLAVARTLRSEPIVISELVRLAAVSISVDGLQYVLSTFQLTGSELAALDDALATAEQDGSRGLWRGLVGERAIGLDTFNLSYKQLEQYGMNLPGQSDGIFGIAGVIAFNVHHLSGLHDADRTIYLDSMQDILNAATNRFPEMLAASQRAMNQVDRRLATGAGRLAFVSRMLLPSLTNTVSKEAAVIVEIRCARIALAIEKYRLGQPGSPPEDLAILNSSKPAELSDPFDGEPFRYARLSKGYRIESRTARSDSEITSMSSTPSVHRKTIESAPKLGFTTAR